METNTTGSGDVSQKILEFFRKISSSPVLMLKVAAAVIIGVIVLAFAIQLTNASFNSLRNQLGLHGQGTVGYAVAPSMPPMADYGGKGGGSMGYSEAAYDVSVNSDYYNGGYGSKAGMPAPSMPTLSTRNVAMTMPYPYPQQGTSGENAEDYEVTDYNANIETRHLNDTCVAIQALKPRTDVIFENANRSEHNCNFTFKVKHSSVEEVLGIIKKLDPKDLSEYTNTIKNQIDDYTNSIDILTKKRTSIDETLKSAIDAYNDVTALATRSQNADALASIINSKIAIIERLTQERININSQLDQLARSKADQLDTIDYSRFNVNVYENKFVDGQAIIDSWKQAAQQFVMSVNRVVQDMTLNLVLVLAFVLQWVLYAIIALVVVKYGWKWGRRFWFS